MTSCKIIELATAKTQVHFAQNYIGVAVQPEQRPDPEQCEGQKINKIFFNFTCNDKPIRADDLVKRIISIDEIVKNIENALPQPDGVLSFLYYTDDDGFVTEMCAEYLRNNRENIYSGTFAKNIQNGINLYIRG